MKCRSRLCSAPQPSIAFIVNSVPLSNFSVWGGGRCSAIRERTRITRSPVSEKAVSIPMHSRVKSSMMRKHAKLTSGTQRVVNEVELPPFVRTRHRHDGVSSNVVNVALSARSQLQAMSAIDSMHAFVVHDETFAPKHDRQTSIPEASALRRDFFKLFDQRGIVNAADAILRDRAWAAGDATRCALGSNHYLGAPSPRLFAARAPGVL